MKALSLSQPWASAIVKGFKTVETRSWPTRYRGQIAIHASAKMTTAHKRYHAEHTSSFLLGEFPLGAIIGVATVYDCLPTEEVVKVIGNPRKIDDGCLVSLIGENTIFLMEPEAAAIERKLGDFSPGRWAWLLHDVRELTEPAPCKGMLGLWTVPSDILTEVAKRVPATIEPVQSRFPRPIDG